MKNQEKITQLEKEIKNIDKVLFTLLILGIVEIIFTTFGVIDLNILSLLTITACSYLFFKHAKKRDTKDTMIRIYYAMELSEEEYDEKFSS
jgi:hypothetical protein